MKLIKANESTASRRRVYFHLVDVTDGLTPETGEASGQPQISSDGGAWTDTGIGTLVSVGNGRYYAELTQSAVETAGTSIETRYKSANTAECPGESVQVVAFDPNDAAALGLSRIDATVGSRLADADYTEPANSDVAAIKAKTDNLPADPASNTQVNTRLAAADYTAPANDDVAAVKAVTDKVDTALEADGAVYRLTENALEQAPAGGSALTPQQVRDALKLAPSPGAPAGGSVDDELDGLATAVASIGGLTGSGALDVTITITDNLGTPLDGAAVWISTDQAGSNVIAGTKYTTALGQVAFKLDAGAYWCHRQLAGYEFDPNPAAIAVS
ncbi:MAG: hypothetical protein BWX88_01111 [Planctomycetes bacterium ADurb.Bin126]|nr:MAG: hypothetical protein BWX88_01111 [Planctomycetes bacterium ADurb.Bin126]